MISQRQALVLALLAANVSLPAGLAGQWEPAPSFPGGSRLAAAGVNQNGTLVALGGRPFIGEAASVHYLLPGALNWQSAAPIGNPLMQPGAGLGPQGQIIVFGGYLISDHFPFYIPLTSGFLYDLTAGEGDGIANMKFARAWFAFATDQQHRLYAIGGRDPAHQTTNVVERYDAVANAWTTLAPLPEARDQATAVCTHDNRILVIGGANAAGQPQTSVFSYDIGLDQWSPVAAQPAALESQAAVLGANGLVYVVGGLSGSAQTKAVYIFNPSTGKWFPGPSLNTARSGAAIALGNDGYIYAMGGYSGAVGTETVERLYTGLSVATPVKRP